jgi:hypothetical protein
MVKTDEIGEQMPPQRYTSYHSDTTFSILDKVRRYIPLNLSNSFEYNGLKYHLGYPTQPFKSSGLWELTSRPMDRYLTTGGTAPSEPSKRQAEFEGAKFDEFIETFEIEGKTVKWVLEHQKEWKYLFSAAHLERVLTGFSFWFIYRQVPCYVTHADMMRRKNAPRGRYLRVYPGVRFDVTPYAPITPGAKH